MFKTSIFLFYKSKLNAKGQLISKCLFGVFNSPKNKQKQFDLRHHSSKVEFFSFVFWET